MSKKPTKEERTRKRTRTNKKPASNPRAEAKQRLGHKEEGRATPPNTTPTHKPKRGVRRPPKPPEKDPNVIEDRLSWCKDKVRGFSKSRDQFCATCNEQDYCQRKTMERLSKLNKNLGRKIFIPLKTKELSESYWEKADIDFEDYKDEDFDKIKHKIFLEFVNWILNFKEDLDYVRETYYSLSSSSRRVLSNIVPNWKEWNDAYLDTVHLPDIELIDAANKDKCSRHARIPHWVIDTWVRILSGSEAKVFLYLIRRSIFDPDNSDFGTCSLTYAQITDRTRVKSLRTVINRLEELGLIERNREVRKVGGLYSTKNHFRVTYFGRMLEKGVWFSKNEREE